VTAERIVKLWDVPCETGEGEFSPETSGSIISLENISFGYSDTNILKDVSIHIEKGQFVALVGESGCGKSTVLKLCAGLYEPDGGVGFVKILGRDTRGWNPSAMRSYMSYVTQDTFLYPGTLRENIIGGSDGISEEKIWEVVEAAQLSGFIKSLLAGLDTQVGERGVFLSGGQRQRISVARALCKRGIQLLLLDEATSALDQTTEADMMKAVTNLKDQDRPAILMITHKLANIKDADRIIVMKNGRICEQGTHSELEGLDGEYVRLLEKQKEDVVF